jgi:hypothetical protein
VTGVSRVGHGLKFLSSSGKQDDFDKARVLRIADQLRGSAGKGPARGARRERLLKELAAVRGAPWLPKDIVQLLRQADQRRLKLKAEAKARAARVARREERQRLATERAQQLAAFRAQHDHWRLAERIRHAEWLEAKKDPYNGFYYRVSTFDALEEGAKDWSKQEIFDYLGGPVVRRNVDKIREYRPGSWAPTDNANSKPHLELPTLIKHDLIHTHEARIAALRWPVWTRGITEYVLMRATGHGQDGVRLFLWRILDDRLSPIEGDGQIVWALPNKENSWNFRCPVTGRRTKTLYLRSGVWASLSGNNLKLEGSEPYRAAPEPKLRLRR